MKQQDFNDLFRNRTKKLALSIISLTSSIKYTDALGVIRKQLIRSGTSAAANFRAVCRAWSEKERYSKLCIVVEEADETVFWLEMMEEAGYISEEESKPLKTEAVEILKVMSAFKNKIEK